MAKHFIELFQRYSQTQVLSKILQFADEKRFEDRNDLTMQVVSIIKGSFFIKRGSIFKISIFIVGCVEILLVGDWLRHVAALYCLKYILYVFKQNISYLSCKRVEILKQNVVHIYNKMGMPYKIVYLNLFLISITSLCSINQNNSLPQAYQDYLSARSLNTTQQKIVLQLYHNLTNLSTYNVDIDHDNHTIFVNSYPLCNTNQTKTTFNALFDIWVCLTSYYLLQCNQQWSLLIECGTFLEIHRPFDVTVLMRFNVQDIYWIKDTNGTLVANLLLNKLCAGMYHIWFVYYSRQGKVIKRVRPIYISYPSCSC